MAKFGTEFAKFGNDWGKEVGQFGCVPPTALLTKLSSIA
jgi:hypothetical protein